MPRLTKRDREIIIDALQAYDHALQLQARRTKNPAERRWYETSRDRAKAVLAKFKAEAGQ